MDRLTKTSHFIFFQNAALISEGTLPTLINCMGILAHIHIAGYTNGKFESLEAFGIIIQQL